MANNKTNEFLYQSVEALKRENKSLVIMLTEVVEYMDRDHTHYKDFIKIELSKKYDFPGN